MSVKQISVFLENKPGALADLTRTLADSGIDMRAFSLAETSDFGIARIIVDDLYKTTTVLKDAGFIHAGSSVLAVRIPESRAFMHLDTVFTQIDHDKFMIHPGILGPLEVFKISRGKGESELRITRKKDTLEDILADALELDEVTLIKCGGGDVITAEREQWNDGSNTLCIAPGKVVVYERNDVTNAILRDHGLTVLEIASSELSRGRGGPRCMSMPLIRE